MKRDKRDMREKDNTGFAISEDSLSKMTDEELHQLFLKVRANINRSKRTVRGVNKKTEVDMCYIQREMQNRRYKKAR